MKNLLRFIITLLLMLAGVSVFGPYDLVGTVIAPCLLYTLDAAEE